MDRFRLTLVLNMAVSDAGKSRIQTEFDLIRRLNRLHPEHYLPEVYSLGDGLSALGEVPMFLGEWLEGYNEFHLSLRSGRQQMIVWGRLGNDIVLTEQQTCSLYRQAATILTTYYNVSSFEQIFPWHHAAGDFVARITDDGLELRLITVRQYASMIQTDPPVRCGEPDRTSIFEALLYFLLNLSVRTRLDRLDGTGEIAWADATAVKPTLEGILVGLAGQPPLPFSEQELVQELSNLLTGLLPEDLMPFLVQIVNAYHPGSPELPIIRRHLREHCQSLYEAHHCR